jgi:hypothetical protein
MRGWPTGKSTSRAWGYSGIFVGREAGPSWRELTRALYRRVNAVTPAEAVNHAAVNDERRQLK